MDAAFPKPTDGGRLLHCPYERSATMPKGLSESEFEEEVNACLPQLISVARRLCSDDEVASDAVQQALLRASKAWRRFHGGSQVGTWLTRIVIHESRRLLSDTSRRRLQTNSISEETQLLLLAATSDGPQRKLQQKELKQLIRLAVGQLPDRQREVFALIVWQELPVATVADLLQIKQQTVYANLHAAREQLKQKLHGYVHVEES